jgi:hypothetical protein
LTPLSTAAAGRIRGVDEGRGIGAQFSARKWARSATLAMARALIAKPLLCRRQNKKCLHFIHRVIFS